MRWSLEELNKARKIHKRDYWLEKITKYPIDFWRRTKTTIHWLFKGYCQESIWSLDHTLRKELYQRVLQFKNMKKNGYPIDFNSLEEWEEELSEIVEKFRIMYERDYENFYNYLYEEAFEKALKSKEKIDFINLDVGVNLEQLHKQDEKQYENDKEALELLKKYFNNLWD